jgi:hypothetical protein
MFPTRLRSSPNCFHATILRTIAVMRDGHGNERDVFVIVDQEGDRTLFKLVEMGTGGDVQRLARELHAPAVVVDMALPALPALDQIPGQRRLSGSSRLVVLRLRTVTDGSANGIVVRQGWQGEPLKASGGADVPSARNIRGRA